MVYLKDFIDWEKEESVKIWSKYSQTTLSDIILDIEQILNMLLTESIKRQNDSYISPTAIIGKNVYIGNNCQIHDYACVRDNCILLNNVIVGHCSEISNSIIFSNTSITHKVTVGSSIIGRNVNLGANVTLAAPNIFNTDMRKLQKNIKIKLLSGEILDTNLAKFGSVIGDDSRIGMNSSCGPGVLLGKSNYVYPNIFLRGRQYEDNKIFKINFDKVIEIMNFFEEDN
jgi:NDP-sugar pyrophosphorylase family protein